MDFFSKEIVVWKELQKTPYSERLLCSIEDQFLGECAFIQGRTSPPLRALEFALDPILYQETGPYSYPITKLLLGTYQEICRYLETLPQKITCKLKIQYLSYQEAIEIIKKLDRRECKIIIDVNHAWDIKQTISLLKKIQRASLLYVEDPALTYEDLVIFYHKTSSPLGLDEMLLQFSQEQILSLPGLSHLILKPSSLGNLSRLTSWHALAKKRHVEITLSSSFEGLLGIAKIIAFHKKLALRTSLGIDTLSYFDPGVIQATQNPHKNNLNFDTLFFHADRKKIEPLLSFNIGNKKRPKFYSSDHRQCQFLLPAIAELRRKLPTQILNFSCGQKS